MSQMQRTSEFPPGFEPAQAKAGRPAVVRLIRWLLEHDPARRPTALQVLESKDLPSSLLESDLAMMLANVDGKQQYRDALMKKLFSTDPAGGAPAPRPPLLAPLPPPPPRRTPTTTPPPFPIIGCHVRTCLRLLQVSAILIRPHPFLPVIVSSILSRGRAQAGCATTRSTSTSRASRSNAGRAGGSARPARR